jgi:hypothetical protein
MGWMLSDFAKLVDVPSQHVQTKQAAKSLSEFFID